MALGDACGLNRATAWRLLSTLESHGFVRRDRSSNHAGRFLAVMSIWGPRDRVFAERLPALGEATMAAVRRLARAERRPPHLIVARRARSEA